MIDTLITGGSGYIGKELIKKIGKEKIRIISRKEHVNIETCICDLENDKIPETAFDGIKTIYHLAAYTHDINYTKKSIQIYKNLNTRATSNLAEMAVVKGVKSFIYISSVKAGGISSQKNFLNEEDQFEPNDVYGKTKRDAEIILKHIFSNTNMHYVILRPSLVYGKKLKGNLELMYNYAKFGFLPPLPETYNKKTMIHINDLVNVILLSERKKSFCGQIFIVTDGSFYSTREIYKSILFSLNKPVPKWTIPIFCFNFLMYFHPKIKFFINKLFESAPYSSKKLQKHGFKAKKKLQNIL